MYFVSWVEWPALPIQIKLFDKNKIEIFIQTYKDILCNKYII